MNRQEKQLLADKVILNDGNFNHLENQLDSYYKKLLKEIK
jgi:dephospho-CoA kinase